MHTPKIASLLAAILLIPAGLVFAASNDAPSICITEAQRAKLIDLVKTDPEAARLFAGIKASADGALKAEPRPIETILMEGKLMSDPGRIETSKSLGDWRKVESLAYTYAVTADAKYAAKAREFVLAWAKVNRSAGDPIDDTQLEPLIVAYDLTRSTFPDADRKIADDYLRQIDAKEKETSDKSGKSHHNNWHSHRLKIIGLIAFTLHDKSLIDHVADDFADQVDHNIQPDGSTYDFHERDALHYHIYDLTPLLTLAIAARNNGIDLYAHHSPEGASLAGAIAFLLPYADGTKQHAEFTHSKVAFDRKRSEAGDKHYDAGSAFDPKNALPALERDEQFDPKLLDLVIKLAKPDAKKFPTWEIVLNEARR